MYCDAHIHLVDLEDRGQKFAHYALPFSWCGATVSHNPQEFERNEILRHTLPATIAGYGIHPQNPDLSHAAFLASLGTAQKIQFIGEAGFDFFGDSPITMRSLEAIHIQTDAFLFQAHLAAEIQLPLVVHVRKAVDVLMKYGKDLAKIPSVIFHCWPGRLEEAQMLIKKGINAYFSFGTPLLRDSKHAIESLLGLPCSRILSETDAPWQPPYGQKHTALEDIIEIVSKMAMVLDLKAESLLPILKKNFEDAYLIRDVEEFSG